MNAKRFFCLNHPAKAFSLGLVALGSFFFGNGFAHADTIYVANDGNNTIEKFNSSGVGAVFASQA